MHKNLVKFGRGFRDIRADKQTDRQTDKQTYLSQTLGSSHPLGGDVGLSPNQ